MISWSHYFGPVVWQKYITVELYAKAKFTSFWKTKGGERRVEFRTSFRVTHWVTPRTSTRAPFLKTPRLPRLPAPPWAQARVHTQCVPFSELKIQTRAGLTSSQMPIARFIPFRQEIGYFPRRIKPVQEKRYWNTSLEASQWNRSVSSPQETQSCSSGASHEKSPLQTKGWKVSQCLTHLRIRVIKLPGLRPCPLRSLWPRHGHWLCGLWPALQKRCLLSRGQLQGLLLLFSSFFSSVNIC